MTEHCVIPGCANQAKHGRNNMCEMHYKRKWRHGDIATRAKRITPEIKQARRERLAVLFQRRRQLNIPFKTLNRHVKSSAAPHMHRYESLDARLGDAAIIRYEVALRAAAADLRALLDQWGY
jgi:hypothetical protein